MSLPWFRLYRELKDDPKIGCLSDSEFRVFIESLCWACERATGGGLGLTMDNSTWAFRRNVTEALQKLLSNGLLVTNNDGELFIPKWEERQKTSDSSAERVRKHRLKRVVTLHSTLQKRDCNALEERRGEEIRKEHSTNGASPLVVSGIPKPVAIAVKAPAKSFNKPTLEVVKLQAAKSGLAEVEAIKFWNYYESNGWRVGRNPMKSWTHALTNWKSNVDARRYESRTVGTSGHRVQNAI